MDHYSHGGHPTAWHCILGITYAIFTGAVSRFQRSLNYSSMKEFQHITRVYPIMCISLMSWSSPNLMKISLNLHVTCIHFLKCISAACHQRSKQRLSKELSDCVVYCKSVHFRSFKHSRIHSKFYEVASFTESKARKHLREAGKSNLSESHFHENIWGQCSMFLPQGTVH